VVNIYVGNLSYEASEDEIRAAFEQHGEVSSVKVIKDRETGRSRGFAFIEMPDDEQGHAALESMNGYPMNGRALKVTEARPREDRGPRGGGSRRRF
jgi:RNA recognition motif-containing protein